MSLFYRAQENFFKIFTTLRKFEKEFAGILKFRYKFDGFYIFFCVLKEGFFDYFGCFW